MEKVAGFVGISYKILQKAEEFVKAGEQEPLLKILQKRRIDNTQLNPVPNWHRVKAKYIILSILLKWRQQFTTEHVKIVVRFYLFG